MRAEVVAVGTELLMGQVVNTNATFISEGLQELGIDVYFHTTVGDNASRLKESLEIATSRSDLIILSGGLGPTNDDITKQILAEFLDEKLITDAKSMEKLLRYFETSGREHTANNDLQALYMEHAIPLANETGFAVGSVLKKNGKLYAVLPGPPNELKPMFNGKLKPYLAQELGEKSQIFSRVLRFYGIGESQLVTKINSLIETQDQVTIAPYAKTGEVTLRLSVKDVSDTHAQQKLDLVEQDILNTSDVREFFYGYGDDNSLAQVVVNLLKEQHATVSAAESLTGGMFQSTLCDVSGASQVFEGGFVTYSFEQKVKLLGLDEKELAQQGMISDYCARKMAEATLQQCNTDFAVSFTGVAGPEKMENQEVGLVYIALAEKGKQTQVERVHLTDGRGRMIIRQNAVLKGLDLLRKRLLQNSL